jgi:hypothetical protein
MAKKTQKEKLLKILHKSGIEVSGNDKFDDGSASWISIRNKDKSIEFIFNGDESKLMYIEVHQTEVVSVEKDTLLAKFK